MSNKNKTIPWISLWNGFARMIISLCALLLDFSLGERFLLPFYNTFFHEEVVNCQSNLRTICNPFTYLCFSQTNVLNFGLYEPRISKNFPLFVAFLSQSKQDENVFHSCGRYVCNLIFNIYRDILPDKHFWSRNILYVTE